MIGIVAGVIGIVLGHSEDVLGLVAIVALVGIGQALALEVDEGTISVAAVGALAGAAIFGPRAALAIAVTISVVEWSARRSALHQLLFNVGALTLASLAAAGVFAIANSVTATARPGHGLARSRRGCRVLRDQHGLVSLAVSLEGHERRWAVWHERFAG